MCIRDSIIGVRNTRVVKINSTVLTCYVMSLGALFYIAGACCTSGLRMVDVYKRQSVSVST